MKFAELFENKKIYKVYYSNNKEKNEFLAFYGTSEEDAIKNFKRKEPEMFNKFTKNTIHKAVETDGKELRVVNEEEGSTGTVAADIAPVERRLGGDPKEAKKKIKIKKKVFRRPISESVEVDVSQYRRAYGKLPKGRGNWAFFIDRNLEDFDNIIWVNDTFNNARKKAISIAKEKGLNNLYLGS